MNELLPPWGADSFRTHLRALPSSLNLKGPGTAGCGCLGSCHLSAKCHVPNRGLSWAVRPEPGPLNAGHPRPVRRAGPREGWPASGAGREGPQASDRLWSGSRTLLAGWPPRGPEACPGTAVPRRAGSHALAGPGSPL